MSQGANFSNYLDPSLLAIIHTFHLHFTDSYCAPSCAPDSFLTLPILTNTWTVIGDRMLTDFDISSLLSGEEEPTHSLYRGAIETVVKYPYQLERLTEGHGKDNVLIHITTRAYRLALLFDGLHRFVRASPKSPSTFQLAAATAAFLTLILPDIDQLLKPPKVLEFLVPALEVCFAPYQPPVLRKLAHVLGKCGTLLEYLASDRSGSRIVRQWAFLPSTLSLDDKTQEAWTERLVKMVSSCPGYHNVAPSIQHWATLIALKRDLEVLEMMMLEDEDNRVYFARPQETKTRSFPLNDDFKAMLNVFDLKAPESLRMVQNHIAILKTDKTSGILHCIVTSFPCKRCIPALGSPPRSTNTESQDQKTRVISSLDMNVLGKAVGVWKVLLSGPALKSVQTSSRFGRSFTPVRDKLIDLASGNWRSSLPGSDNQRRHLKVPLAKSRCGKGSSILWQVDIGIAGDRGLLQQVVVVWELGDSEEIIKAIDRVISIQASYTDERIRCCRHSPSISDGKWIPATFDQDTPQLATLREPSAELDVRSVDQHTIDMANKFYALTEPVIRSIVDNDLTAEFPFSLSMEEDRVIKHFQTASLILGRSGTGKTTCLVFKLVAKFLASKAVLDERPARQVSSEMIVVFLFAANQDQVLLTRSSFLAGKLQAYTRRLIVTLSSKSLHPESFELEEDLLSRTIEKESQSSSVLTLRDQSFPLVCTFEQFLGILENTAIELDRQDYESPSSHQYHEIPGTKRPHQRQTVDFYAFKVDYWPRFAQNLTKDLSVNLVFAEIMGVIKGSIFSRVSLAPISCEEYLKRSCRLAPTFASEAERLCVYDIFELYEKLKIERGDLDYVDRVVRVLRAVRRDPSLYHLLRSTFDEIYIDEIQDQRSLDIELFLSFLKDGRGFHFAGDTAQAISHDSTFRFSDIKRLFYEHFAEVGASAKQIELAVPQMFTLSKNYRSHQGILAISSLVMGMIWKGFPETVDKLDPEVGNLRGPKPVLFLGCGVEILLERDVGESKLSERAADFGAEQVILVRDIRSKTNLRNQLGDVALILTILESKGMEFADVILWNFFSECPDQVGVRVLNALKNDEDGFDPRKHSGMCLELKHLYVAITRARNKLFMIESSEITATPILKLLTEGSQGPLVEVTRPNDEAFALRVEALRPNTSEDPVAWSKTADGLMAQRMFEPAILAFRRAGDTQGETKARGFLKEEEARDHHAKNNTEAFTRDMRLAIEHFLKGKLVVDAVRVLIQLGELGEAAEEWYQCKEYSKAAPLFTDAGLFIKAHDCHDRLKQYGEAAASLRQGSNYDKMVEYVDKHRKHIDSDALRGYSLLCKLLLKQNKVSSLYRNHAIGLLGTVSEREACFLQYGMDEQLAELYAEQKRHKDLYDLFSRTGQLERALETVVSNDLLQSGTGIPESAVLKLLDCVWVGHMMKKRQQDFAASLRLRSDRLTTTLIRRLEHWEAGYHANSEGGSNGHPTLADRQHAVVGKILTLQKGIDATAFSTMPKLDDVPFEMMQDSVRMIQDLALRTDEHVMSILFVLTGVWTLGDGNERCILLPWSPFKVNITNLSATDIASAAKKWAFEKFASTVLALDSRAKVLWNSKWRARCLNHLTTGTCRQRNCQKLHEKLSQDDCLQILEDLLRVNNFFCALSVLYYSHVMNTTFQKKYLGIRRQWLERLLRELTFLSSVEQSASVTAKIQKELLRGDKSLAVRSSLEELLYFRLRTEWKDRSEFTALLEQMQTAEAFGMSSSLQ